MAADAYLKVAAGQLQQAASAVKQDVDRLHAEATAFRQQSERGITSKQSELAALRVQADGHRGQPEAAGMEQQIKRLEQDIAGLKQQIDQRNNEVARATQGKQGAMQNLQNEASKLNQQASDPNLR